ncbi:MAG: malate synthase G, partial [Paracoccaceae bacterium]
MTRVEKHRLQVASELVTFIEDEALVGTGIEAPAFWEAFSRIVHELAPVNRAHLDKRAVLQGKIDAWHRDNKGQVTDPGAYKAFLEEIGYLVPEGPEFTIETAHIDPEIATIPGPQLVVPITNARYALNAANARWGSLYDALYGTDALGDLADAPGYDAARGARVIAWARAHLDKALPLAIGSWTDVDALAVKDGVFSPALAHPSQYAGHSIGGGVGRFLFKKNGLGIVISVDPTSRIGAQDKADISDIHLEAAVSAIMDCEDSVACVDAEDKIVAYRNWLGLMKGDLSVEVAKGDDTFIRDLNPDLMFHGPDDESVTQKGRALMLIRNVGHLMTNPAILLEDGSEIPEGIMDAMITTMIAMHDLARDGGNSVEGSVYVVKPKMHGPDEVGF